MSEIKYVKKINSNLQPWMPGRIHTTQIIRIVCSLHESAHFVRFDIVEIGNTIQSLHDGVHRLVNQRNDLVHVDGIVVHLNDVTIGVQYRLFVLEPLLLHRYDLITKYGP